MSRHICTGCGQYHEAKDARKEHMNKMKLTMLQRAVQHVIETEKNDFMVRDIAGEHEFKRFNNFQKLRYHGLVTPVRVNGQRQKGRWLITRNGWAFLRGKIEIPSYVTVQDNKIQDRSKQIISVRDVYYGAEEIQTTFEYIDEHGNKIGVRPLNIRQQQVALL